MKMRAPTHLKDLQRYFRYSCERIEPSANLAAKRQQNLAPGVSQALALGLISDRTQAAKRRQMLQICRPFGALTWTNTNPSARAGLSSHAASRLGQHALAPGYLSRSEERRVGKEGRRLRAPAA